MDISLVPNTIFGTLFIVAKKLLQIVHDKAFVIIPEK
jgi:hypothetical protein